MLSPCMAWTGVSKKTLKSAELVWGVWDTGLWQTPRDFGGWGRGVGGMEPGRIFARNEIYVFGYRERDVVRDYSARGIKTCRAADDPFSGRAMLYAAQLFSKTMLRV